MYETRAYDFYLGINNLENLQIIVYEIEEMNNRLKGLNGSPMTMLKQYQNYKNS
ncbi:hypothetical protein [Brassicibacter mesophilus]|uniref:hypothetical protein n=1 Tax=Brassicibacter mesophilus TaxID=745119 RepID=UPI003D20DF00